MGPFIFINSWLKYTQACMHSGQTKHMLTFVLQTITAPESNSESLSIDKTELEELQKRLQVNHRRQVQRVRAGDSESEDDEQLDYVNVEEIKGSQQQNGAMVSLILLGYGQTGVSTSNSKLRVAVSIPN